MSANEESHSSAVVVPDSRASKSPTTKRPRSSSPEPAPKRARISDGSSHSPSTLRSSPPVAEPVKKAQNNVAEPRLEKRKNSIQEEKKRGQRLFGSMLSTLSRSTPDGAQKRRQEIERRQAEKAKQQAIDNKARETEKLAKLKALRRTQQIKFDEAAMRTRHSNMLAMANYLSTKTEPRLYYKPWKLLPTHEERIQNQMAEAKVLIAQQVDDFYTRHTHLTRPKEPTIQEPEASVGERASGMSKETAGERAADSVSVSNTHDDDVDDDDNDNDTTNLADTEADHIGEIVVEAEEDTVIY